MFRFYSFHFLSGDNLMFILAGKANDQAKDNCGKTADCQPDDIPSHGKAKKQGEDANKKAHRSIFWKMDIFVIFFRRRRLPSFIAHKGSS